MKCIRSAGSATRPQPTDSSTITVRGTASANTGTVDMRRLHLHASGSGTSSSNDVSEGDVLITCSGSSDDTGSIDESDSAYDVMAIPPWDDMSTGSKAMFSLVNDCRRVMDALSDLEALPELQALEQDLLQLMQAYDRDSQFGSLRQGLGLLLSSELVYFGGFGSMSATGKATRWPYATMFSGVFLVLLMPLAKLPRTGTAGNPAMAEYLKQARILTRKLRDLVGCPPTSQTSNPWQEFSVRKLLKNFALTFIADDLPVMFFWLNYSIKNVVPTLAGQPDLYRSSPGTDIALQLLAGSMSSACMTLTSQCIRYRLWPEAYQRAPDAALLDKQIAYCARLREELEALPGSGANATDDSAEINDSRRAHTCDTRNELITRIDEHRNTLVQERQKAASQLTTDYRNIFTQRMAGSIATAASISLAQIGAIVVSLQMAETLRQDPGLDDRLYADLVPPLLLGLGLTFFQDASLVMRFMAAPALGIYDHVRRAGERCFGIDPAVEGRAEPNEIELLQASVTPWG